MQVDRRFEGTNDEQQAHRHVALTRASVWIDRVEQHNVSTSYVEREQREQEGQRRRRNVVSPSIPTIHPITPAQPMPVPARASASPAHSLSVRHRALRTCVLPESQQQDLTDFADIPDMPTLPPTGERQAEHASSLFPEARIPLRSRLHPESTASRLKNASLSPQRAIDELDTVPPILPVPPVTPVPSMEHIEQAIDEIDTILPISPSIDELDTLPLPLKSLRHSQDKVSNQTNVRKTEPLHENEVDIDEIDTLAPGSVTVLPPKPMPRQAEPIRTQVTIVDSRPPVQSTRTGQIGKIGRNVSWTTGVGARSEYAKLIADKARARQGKPLGELVLTPLSEARWWLLYPGRMEFILWISGALILLSVTCVLLFATLASTGFIRVATMDTTTGAHVIHKSTPCTTSTSHCHSAGTVVASGAKNKQHSPSNSGTSQTTLAPVTTPIASKTPGTSSNNPTGGVGTSTPVSQTPVSASPTVGISPTVEPTRTTPTPAPTKTVTASPTAGITPTIGTTPPTKKPTTTTSHHTDSQTLSLDNALNNGTPSQGGITNTWMWLVLVGYAFSMVMLGLAALLYHRKRGAS